MNDVYFDYATKFQNLVEEIFYIGVNNVQLQIKDEFDLDRGFSKKEEIELLRRFELL